MWRPMEIGEVIAHRRCELVRDGKKSIIHLRFGKPVQKPEAKTPDPWFCPMSITGRPIADEFVPVAGVDSLQALILALSLASDRIPLIAERVGGRIHWLGDEERVVLGRHVLAGAAEDALQAMTARFVRAAAILDPGTQASRRHRDRAVDALRAIVRDVDKAQPRREPRRKRDPER